MNKQITVTFLMVIGVMLVVATSAMVLYEMKPANAKSTFCVEGADLCNLGQSKKDCQASDETCVNIHKELKKP